MNHYQPVLPTPTVGIVIDLGRDDPELRRAQEELYSQSDRACAVLAAALLDAALRDLLERFLMEGRSKAILDDVRGAGGTFSSRIHLCHALGLIQEFEFRELELIRRIRNDFAHGHGELLFTSQATADRIGALSSFDRTASPPEEVRKAMSHPRTRFLFSSMFMLARLTGNARRVIRLSEYQYPDTIVLP